MHKLREKRVPSLILPHTRLRHNEHPPKINNANQEELSCTNKSSPNTPVTCAYTPFEGLILDY